LDYLSFLYRKQRKRLTSQRGQFWGRAALAPVTLFKSPGAFTFRDVREGAGLRLFATIYHQMGCSYRL
jgi:hypothetical protein